MWSPFSSFTGNVHVLPPSLTEGVSTGPQISSERRARSPGRTTALTGASKPFDGAYTAGITAS